MKIFTNLAIVVLVLCALPAVSLAEELKGPASTTRPATLPSPGEMIRQMKEAAKAKDALTKVAYIDISRPIVERANEFSLFGGSGSISLRSLIQRLHKARDDKDIKAVLITINNGQVNLAQAQEIRDALGEIDKAGKLTFVYADSYDTRSYTLASGASDVCILAGGEIMIPGAGIETTFAKGLLDKIGVQADYIQIGEYKGADEAFTRTGPSDELRGELNHLVENLYAQIVDGIAKQRNLPRDAVQAVINDTILTGETAKQRGLVDHLIDQDGMRHLIEEKLNQKEINLIANYGKKEHEEIDFSNPLAILSMMTRKPEPTTRPAVALVYAKGMIIDGKGGDGLFGGSAIGSEEIRKSLRIASRDPQVKAVVIRIDSPGGSALASEVMWQAARRAAKDKPLIISIGGMAASGGYYLASAGETIFADRSAIVGSIGVVGGKFVMKDLYDKLGLKSEAFLKGDNAGLFSSNQPFTDRQRRMVTNWMKQTYDQFTQRVMTTREGKIKDIDRVARGRIFLAEQAKDLGMVDEIGGIEDAISFAAGKANLKPDEYDVRVLPAAKTLADMLNPDSDDAAMPFQQKVEISPDSVLRALSPEIFQKLAVQMQSLQLLQDRNVVLISPFTVSVR